MTRNAEIRALLLEMLRHAEPPRWTGPGPHDSLLEEGDAWAEHVKQWVRDQRARIDALVPEERPSWDGVERRLYFESYWQGKHWKLFADRRSGWGNHRAPLVSPQHDEPPHNASDAPEVDPAR